MEIMQNYNTFSVRFFVSLHIIMTKPMKIGICNDHAGVDYKFKLVKMLQNKGIEVSILERILRTVWIIRTMRIGWHRPSRAAR